MNSTGRYNAEKNWFGSIGLSAYVIKQKQKLRDVVNTEIYPCQWNDCNLPGLSHVSIPIITGTFGKSCLLCDLTDIWM